jgi:hypothetical protein
MAEAARPQFGVPFFERAYGWVLVRVVAMLPVETLLVRFQRVPDTLLALCPAREAAGTRRVLVFARQCGTSTRGSERCALSSGWRS